MLSKLTLFLYIYLFILDNEAEAKARLERKRPAIPNPKYIHSATDATSSSLSDNDVESHSPQAKRQKKCKEVSHCYYYPYLLMLNTPSEACSNISDILFASMETNQ